MKRPLLLALLFLSPAVTATAADLWLHPPTKGNADPGPANAWLEGRVWEVIDPRKYEAPVTPALKLGLGVWYEPLVDPSDKKAFLPRATPRKPVAKTIDLDAISVIAPEKKEERSSSLTDDPEFEALREKLDSLMAELETVTITPRK